MCPECSDKLYGKEDWYIEMKNEKNEKNNERMIHFILHIKGGQYAKYKMP